MSVFASLVLLVAGAVVTGVIDHYLGISFADVNIVSHILHKLMYTGWGYILFKNILN